ncbi:MAG: ACT domain-containing protein [Pseudomonadota bacterium]
MAAPVDASNVPGSLARIAEIVAEHGGNIVDLALEPLDAAGSETKSVRMTINLEVSDLKTLNIVMNDLRSNPLVRQVSRRME